MKHPLRSYTRANWARSPVLFLPALTRSLGVIVGALLASVGVELFLMPHGIIVGGMTGLSALLALKTEMRLGFFLFLLNLPILLLGRRNIHLSFGIFTVLGILVFSLGTIVLHPYPALTSDPLPAAMLGGASLGLGLGLALRFGGALDIAGKAVETLHYKRLSPEKLLLLLNCGILIAAGFHFGFIQAAYSVIAYILAFEAVKFPMRHTRLAQVVRIKSRHSLAIQEQLQRSLNVNVTYRQKPEECPDAYGILECDCHFLERARLKSIVRLCDHESEITFL